MRPSVMASLARAEERLRAAGETDPARRLLQLREGLDRPELRAVIFGEFNRGKSTLINALLGGVVLPARLIPTTGHVTRVLHGPGKEVRVQHLDGRVEICGLDRLDGLASLDTDGQAREDVAVIEVAVNSPLLRDGLVLIDTPGVNEHEAQTRRAREALALADLVLLILDARQVLNQGERSLAVEWLSEGLGKPMAVVVNFMNFLDDPDRDGVRRRLAPWCRDHLRSELGRPWFEVNALGALAHALGRKPAPADDFPALRAALAGCTGPARQALQARGRKGQILAEVRAARAQNAGLLGRLHTDAARLEQERAALRHDLGRQQRLLQADARAQRQRLTAFAEGRLNTTLGGLVVKLQGRNGKAPTKAELRAQAGDWYRQAAGDAVRAVEKETDAALLGMAGRTLRRPDPMTIGERLTLNESIHVGDELGGRLRGLLGDGATDVLERVMAYDYGPKYVSQVRQKWLDFHRSVLATLHAQYDARVAELGREIDGRLTRDGPLAAELQQREALEAALRQCEREVAAL